MRKVIYAMSVSLDGFIEAADGDIGWFAPDEEMHQHFNDRESAIDTYLYGRRLYENMAAYWPTAGETPSAPRVEVEYARIWNDMQKIVFSKTLKQVRWNSRLASGNIAEEIKRLKAQPGKDMSLGGAGIASEFRRLGLIDEYCLYVHPIVFGSGKPMFPAPGGRLNLQLVETHTIGSGVVLLKYRPADEHNEGRAA